MTSVISGAAEQDVQAHRQKLDAHVRAMVQWHFSPETGCPFWLEWAEKAGWDPRETVQGFQDLERFGYFEDAWLRGGPVRRWVPSAARALFDTQIRAVDVFQ